MSYLLFVDESGQDHRASPYEVLAGAAVHDTRLWDLVCAVHDAEVEFFGTRVSRDGDELKARRLLKTKTFRLAERIPPLPAPVRASLAAAALNDGANATMEEVCALAQAKIAFAARVLDLCVEHGVRAFVSIVHPGAPRPASGALWKDYAYLFERFFYFLDEQPLSERGLIVFDDVGQASAHLLVGQISEYFRQTFKGRTRASRIVPAPLFVRSDLTTGVQIADLIAYLVSWNVRFGEMTAPARSELDALGQQVRALRHRTALERAGYDSGFVVWSFTHIRDLRPWTERGAEAEL